ncbi:MAG TPA: hypothetical protein VGG71_09055, partial [Chitinophagaceae bacterium]
MKKIYFFKAEQPAMSFVFKVFSQTSKQYLHALKNRSGTLLLFIFFFTHSYSQSIVDGSFEHCNTSSLIAGPANTVQTVVLTPCGS